MGKFEKRSYFNFNDSARAVLALHFGWKFRLYHWLTVLFALLILVQDSRVSTSSSRGSGFRLPLGARMERTKKAALLIKFIFSVTQTSNIMMIDFLYHDFITLYVSLVKIWQQKRTYGPFINSNSRLRVFTMYILLSNSFEHQKMKINTTLVTGSHSHVHIFFS